MKKEKKLGFTLIELLAVIVVLAIILAIAIPGISGIISNSTKSSFKSDAKMILKAVDYKKLEDDSFDPLSLTKDNVDDLLKISNTNYSQVSVSLTGNDLKLIVVGTGKWNGLTAYGTFKTMKVVNSGDYDEVPPIITILGNNPITVDAGATYTDAGATATDLKDGDLTAGIVKTGTVDTSTIGTYTITYTVSDSGGNTATSSRTVNVIREGNAPVLATGLTPVKWDGANWIDTTADDLDWYRYSTTDKKWANARTADGSMWVWIPRYVYKISSGWHSSTTGVIDIKFSIETDDTRGGEITLDAGATSDASNNKWTNHPAFTFGTTELTGIWIAKFEVSGTTAAIDIKPNVTSLRSVNLSNMFSSTRNMETNNRYGWGTTGTGIDTHLIKNTEWGAVAYLTHSTYGKNAEVWSNNSNTYITGCAGSSREATAYAGCEYSYNTSNGIQASTTGNIYGVYDMSGGAWEYTAAYVNNGASNLASYASNVVGAAAKYKDVYTKAATENAANNYALTINLKGDALYETSGSYASYNAWNSDYTVMPYGEFACYMRSGTYADGVATGIFAYYNFNCNAVDTVGYRPILAIEAGL